MTQQIVRGVLGAEPEGQTDPAAVASSIVQALDRLLNELEPLVGGQSIRALYARALHLNRPSFHWPTLTGREVRSELLAGLHESLRACPPEVARRAGEALLNTFAELLVTLVGEPLTRRLLQSAWALGSVGTPSLEKLP